ncbi:hypothetical protein OsI_15171 [Oryza sativa Indica Group]|uniref:PUM-HD domain-containing protein n=1 Tax=Oryza sativa subsp. indica TaxID=39946 RepID=A2XRB3_ORYSI|nr:hypothetical protein OsI_15171 [Oryza sativa Indica Group]
MTFASSFGVGSQLLGSQAIEVVDVVGGLTSQWGTQLHGGHLARVISYIRAFHDPEQQILSNLVTHQSIETMLNHYAQTAEMSYSMRYPENAVTRGPQNVSGFPQTNGQINTLNNMNSEFHFLLEQAKNPENNSMRLINIRGHLCAFSIDPFGSRFIQHKLERATPAELAMLLRYGPTFYRRELIGKLTGRVVALSLHVYGCRVIQKAFEVSDMDQRIEMANERVLEWCDDPEILKGLMSEIVEGVLELAIDQFGNYVVQVEKEKEKMKVIKIVFFLRF